MAQTFFPISQALRTEYETDRHQSFMRLFSNDYGPLVWNNELGDFAFRTYGWKFWNPQYFPVIGLSKAMDYYWGGTIDPRKDGELAKTVKILATICAHRRDPTGGYKAFYSDWLTTKQTRGWLAKDMLLEYEILLANSPNEDGFPTIIANAIEKWVQECDK